MGFLVGILTGLGFGAILSGQQVLGVILILAATLTTVFTISDRN